MPKPCHEEPYEYNGINALIQIFKEKLKFSGFWTCKECGESNGCMGISSSFEVTLTNSKHGFEIHTNQRHH